MTTKQRAEEAAPSQSELGLTSRPWLVALLERALIAQQAEHEAEYEGILKTWKRDYDGAVKRGDLWMADCKKAEAERDAAVAEALERAAKECKLQIFKADLFPDQAADQCAAAIRALKPRTDMVSVPIALAERTEAMFRSVDPEGVIAQQWTALLAAEVDKETKE